MVHVILSTVLSSLVFCAGLENVDPATARRTAQRRIWWTSARQPWYSCVSPVARTHLALMVSYKSLNSLGIGNIYTVSIKTHTPIPFTCESLQINKWASEHFFMTKGGDFWFIRHFLHLPETQGWGWGGGWILKNISSSNPYLVVPHFQSIGIRIAQTNVI